MKRATRTSLAAGVIAGPLFVIVGLTQAFTREGFDLRHHTLSLLENGDHGWIQIANFVVSGALFLACAVGMRAGLTSGRAGMWGPRLIAAFGVGMIAAGAFAPDPAFGFPPGTPDGKPSSVSWHGALHYTFASVAFLALIAACVVFARHFRALDERGWAIGSALVGGLILVGVGSVASGSQTTVGNLTFAAAALLGFLWVSVLAARLRSDAAQAVAHVRSPLTERERAYAPIGS
jgi:hypothetical protein